MNIQQIIRWLFALPCMSPYVITINIVIVIIFVVGVVFSIIAGQADYNAVYGLEYKTILSGPERFAILRILI